MATPLYNGIRPMPGTRIPNASQTVVAFAGKLPTVAPVMGYGEVPKPLISYLDNASNPNVANRVLCCKQLPGAVIENTPKLFPRGFGMYPTTGYLRHQKPGLAYIRPIKGPIMKQADNQFALLDTRIPGLPGE